MLKHANSPNPPPTHTQPVLKLHQMRLILIQKKYGLSQPNSDMHFTNTSRFRLQISDSPTRAADATPPLARARRDVHLLCHRGHGQEGDGRGDEPVAHGAEAGRGAVQQELGRVRDDAARDRRGARSHTGALPRGARARSADRGRARARSSRSTTRSTLSS